jgi:hypothetical protein
VQQRASATWLRLRAVLPLTVWYQRRSRRTLSRAAASERHLAASLCSAAAAALASASRRYCHTAVISQAPAVKFRNSDLIEISIG